MLEAVFTAVGILAICVGIGLFIQSAIAYIVEFVQLFLPEKEEK